MKFICFDYGEKRTGVAVTDDGGAMAFPRPAIIKITRKDFFERIEKLLVAEHPDGIVLGLPLHADGTDSLVCRQVRNLAQSLLRRFEVPVYFMDERYSSAEAESMLRESGQRAYKRDGSADGRVDSLAAVRILESFLNLPEDKREQADS